MIYLYLISVFGGDPVKVDAYQTMQQCVVAIDKVRTKEFYIANFARFVCVPNAAAVGDK